MGKGTIVSHIGSGRYNVTLKIDRARAQALITELTGQIAYYDSNILPALNQKQTRASLEYQGVLGKLNTAISDYNTGAIGSDGLRKVIDQVNLKRVTFNVADRAYKEGLLARNSLASRKKFIEDNLGSDPTVQAWCADLTENLSGDVGTIEIPNERIHDVLIRPGYGGGAAYSASRDGQLQETISGTPSSVYYNFALFPGWQKWKPTYRVGTITNISGDNCDLTLDAAINSQGFDVNAQSTYTNVPIVYMDCNGQPFQVNDRVIVEFIDQDHTDPRVIGFETNPVGCRLDLFSYTLSTYWYIKRHDAISATILNSCKPGGLNLTLATSRGGTTYDWNVDKLYLFDYTSARVYKTGDITGGNECIITGWVSSFPTDTTALAFDGTDLWSAFYQSGVGMVIRQFSGISATVNQSWTIGSPTNPVFPYSMTYIGSGYFALGVRDISKAPQAARVQIYLHSGSSFTYQSDFIWPPGAIDGFGYNCRGPDGISIYKGNLITYGGRKQLSPPRYDFITLHQGITATILEQYSYSAIMADGLNYPDAIT